MTGAGPTRNALRDSGASTANALPGLLRHRLGDADAVLALGVLIRGETPQYAVIAHAVAQGLTQVAVMSGIPVTFGVIVAGTVAQAKARAGGAKGNRGEEAALAALEMLRPIKR